MDALEILENPSKEVSKGELFAALLNDDDVEEALNDYDGPERIDLRSLLHYNGDSPLLQSIQCVSHLVNRGVIRDQRSLLLELQRSFGSLSVDHLSDPSRYSSLTLASLVESSSGPRFSFTFVGRPELSFLAGEVQAALKDAWRYRIDYGGPPGRGKSFILAALAGLWIVNRSDVPVVYILSETLVSKPHEKLREALLLAFWRHPKQQLAIMRCQSMEELAEWCVWQPQKLLFIIDEAHVFDNEKKLAASSLRDRELARRYLDEAVCKHCSLWCSSTKGVCSIYKNFSEKEQQLLLERPFNHQEVTTWMTAMEEQGLTIASCLELLYFTGYIPSLLTAFAERGPRISKLELATLFKDFSNKAEDFSFESLNTLRTLLSGGRVPRETIGLDESFFHVDEGADDLDPYARVWCPCPFLETKVRELVRRKMGEPLYKQLIDETEDWSAAICLDAAHSNPARMALLVEGMVIDRLKVLGCLGGFSFKHSKTFSIGSEAGALSSCQAKELFDGILFQPVEFNSRAIDAVLVKLEENRRLHVVGVQISVTTWKRGAEKNSHGLWLNKLGGAWRRSSDVTLVPGFVYLLSDAARSQSQVSLLNDDCSDFKVMKFADVHPNLSFVDTLSIPEPSERRQCKGSTTCTRFKVQVELDYYCKDHEVESGSAAKRQKTR